MNPCEGEQLRPEVNWGNVQAMLRWGVSSHKYGALILGTFTDPARLVDWLRENVSLMSAGDKNALLSSSVFHNLGLSASALRKLNVNVDENFPFEFAQGMSSERAAHVLGDIPASWIWGNQSEEDFALIIYSRCAEQLETEIERLSNVSAESELTIQRCYLDTHEHFGFRDGIANPKIRGASSKMNTANEIAAGEFIFGYSDERGMYPPPPLQEAENFGDFPVSFDNPEKREIGRDGSFLVVRQLQQYPDRFQQYLEANATEELSAERLGAKMMGRWKDGSPLTLTPDAPDARLSHADDFGFTSTDRQGDNCPMGAHIRRSNPRDSLTKDPEESLQIANRHRILRRSRMYKNDDQVGLIFMCFNTSLSRQFEHIQETWINGKRFARTNEKDPILGNRQDNTSFTFPNGPLLSQVDELPDFVKTLGGGYFFFPALDVYQTLVEQAEGDVHAI